MSETEPLVPEGWEMHASRAATLHLGGARYRLKVPRMGELRQITEAISDMTSSATELVHSVDAQLEDMRKKVEAEEATTGDLTAESRRLSRELNRQIEDAWFEVLAGIFDVLGCPMPDPEEAPAWFTTSARSQIEALVLHFRSCPPARGGVAPR